MTSGVLAITVVVKENHSSALIILIPALAGILGALIGGWTTGRFTLKGEEERQAFARDLETKRYEREDAARATVIRGAARVLAGQLKAIEQAARLSIEMKHWWPRGTVPEPSLSLEDLKLLASAMDVEDWKYVDGALSITQRVMMRRQWEPDPSDDPLVSTPLSPGDDKLLEAVREVVIHAVRRLKTVGETAAVPSVAD